MTLGTHLYLPKGYACAKFGCYSSINDVTMTSSMFVRQLYQKCCICFNSSFICYENVAGVFIRLFEMLELHFNGKIAKSVMKLSNSGLQNLIKLLKF